MTSNEEKIRAAIAEQAGEWFVANHEEPLSETDAAALAAWLKGSPVHVEEFLGVSVIARDLKEARTDPEFSLDAVLARARAAEEPIVQPLWPRVIDAVRDRTSGRWLTAAVTMAACALLSLGLLLTWNARQPIEHAASPEVVTSLHFETRHGEHLEHRLADNSLLHLDTDSAVTIRYSKNERLVMLTAGQAEFEVTHQPSRAFRVIAGSAQVTDLGTKFDVRLEQGATVVTVVEGRVAVGASPISEKLGTNPGQSHGEQFTQLSANQQIRVAEGEWPSTPITVDAERSTAWMHGQIAFDHEPLERVVAEYNRYTAKPIEVATPSLRTLQISGVFATDDPEAFIAFLRSLKGVRVEVTATHVRVSGDHH
jgi:transmembrane sensor